MYDNFDDHFTENEIEEQPQVRQETEQEREEREIREATIERRGNSIKMVLALIIIAMVAFLGWWMWQHYFHPYRISQEKGWIMKVSNEGTLFKTVEGEMISEGYVQDTLLAMRSDFKFSIPNDSLAREAMRWSQNGQRIVLTYDEYKGTVLWRGNSRHVVTKIEPDTNLIMPNPHKN
jgi:hypothetical protein